MARKKKLTKKQRRYLAAMGIIGGVGIGLGAGLTGLKVASKVGKYGARLGNKLGRKAQLKHLRKVRGSQSRADELKLDRTTRLIRGSSRRMTGKFSIAGKSRRMRDRFETGGYYASAIGLAAPAVTAGAMYMDRKEKQYRKANNRKRSARRRRR